MAVKRSRASPKVARYLHGFTAKEQKRLYRQAEFLESSVYSHVDLSGSERCLEVGCGVGAQTAILHRRFPNLHITGVDASREQLTQARKALVKQIRQKSVELIHADGQALPFRADRFDSAFLVWFLEHVESPVEILREIHRVLKSGAVVYCTEVLNATFFLHPYSPATLKFWFEYNDYQWTLKGDPFVGAKLANLLLSAGYQNVSLEVKNLHFDNREPKRRAECFEYWTNLLLSGTPGLLKSGRVTPQLIQEMREELSRLKTDPNAVFFYSYVQAKAHVL